MGPRLFLVWTEGRSEGGSGIRGMKNLRGGGWPWRAGRTLHDPRYEELPGRLCFSPRSPVWLRNQTDGSDSWFRAGLFGRNITR